MQFDYTVSYDKKECGACHFYWYYPMLKEKSLTSLDKLFFMQIEFCPYCKFASDNISVINDDEYNFFKSRQYQAIVKNTNNRYNLVVRKGKESFTCIAFAYLKVSTKEYLLAGKAFLMGARREEIQYKKYMESSLYKPELEKSLIEESIQKIKEYNKKGLEYLLKHYNQDMMLSIQDCLLLSYAYAINMQTDLAKQYLSKSLKLKPSTEYLSTIQDLNSLIKGI